MPFGGNDQSPFGNALSGQSSAPASTGGGLGGLLSNPNVIKFLAGTGARLDPEGVGGALGGATGDWVENQQMGKAMEKQNSTMQELIKALGSGQLKKVDIKADGGISFAGNEQQQESLGTTTQPMKTESEVPEELQSIMTNLQRMFGSMMGGK